MYASLPLEVVLSHILFTSRVVESITVCSCGLNLGQAKTVVTVVSVVDYLQHDLNTISLTEDIPSSLFILHAKHSKHCKKIVLLV